MKALRAAILLLLVPAVGTCGVARAGKASVQFLKLGVGARYEAMGGAAVAFCDDANALRWNPANLAGIQENAFTLTQGFEASAKRQFAAFARPVGDAGTAGIFGQVVSVGTLNGTDDIGNPLGTISPRDAVFGFGWGWSFSRDLKVGAVVEVIQSKIIHSASTLADSVGINYTWRGVSAAAVVRDAGGRLKYDDRTEDVPMTVQAGVSYRPTGSWLVALDGIAPKDAEFSVGAGAEYLLDVSRGMTLAFRGGFNSRLNAVPGSGFAQGMSAGLGCRWSLFDVDYAWAPWGDVAQTHRISMNLRFGRKP